MLGVEMESLSSNAVVLESILRSAMEAVVVETAIVVSNSIFWYLLTMGSTPNGINVPLKEPGILGRFPFGELHAVKKPAPENKDGSDTEDDEEDDDEDAADDQDDVADEEDGSGEEGEDEGDPEDEPEANGDGGSGDEDDDDEDEDEDDGEEDEEEEEEEDEEDEEEIPQPPTKKRK